jgi:hypothetical protein
LKGDKLYRKMPERKRTKKQLEKDHSANMIKTLQFQVKKLAEEKESVVAQLQHQNHKAPLLVPVLK